jgi:hypothetical protein
MGIIIGEKKLKKIEENKQKWLQAYKRTVFGTVEN